MNNFLLCNILALIIVALSPIHARAGLSNDTQEIKTLYEELKKFKDDPKFHEIGFGRCCRFYKWMERVKPLRSKKRARAILMEVGFFPGEVLQLGMEYLKTKGRPNSWTKEMKGNIGKGLYPKKK